MGCVWLYGEGVSLWSPCVCFVVLSLCSFCPELGGGFDKLRWDGCHRLGGAWSETAHCALRAALGKEENGSHSREVVSQSRDCAGDVGGKQPVPRGLGGRTLLSQRRRGQGSESTAERCWQCCPVPVIAVSQEVKANSAGLRCR